MLKKIFYFLVAGFFGIAIWFINYQSDIHHYTSNMAKEAILEERYTDVVRIFGGLFDKRSLIKENNEKVILQIYPGTEQTQLIYYDNDEQKSYVNFERSYYFYLFNIGYNLETYVLEDKKVNYSSIRFYSNSNTYDYFFINNSEINKESYVSKPSSYEEAVFNSIRDFVSSYNNLNFVNVNFTETMINYIETKIGEINKIAIVDAKNTIVEEYVVSLDFNDQLFVDAGEMIDKYSYTLIEYEKINDKEAQSKLVDDFNIFYEDWFSSFKENMNNNYEFRFDNNVLSPKSLYFKSAWALVIYLVIVVLFYLILFHRRGLNNFARRIAKKELLKEQKPLKPHNIQDDFIDVDNPKIPENENEQENLIQGDKNEN